MKRNILCIALLSFVFSVYANNLQEPSVPQNIKEYVSEKYPKAGHIEWNQKKKLYTALFYVDGKETKLEFEENGKLLSSEEVVFNRDLPSFITDHIKKNYPDVEIVNSLKSMKNGAVTYNVEILAVDKNGYTKSQHILFDGQGKVLKK